MLVIAAFAIIITVLLWFSFIQNVMTFQKLSKGVTTYSKVRVFVCKFSVN